MTEYRIAITDAAGKTMSVLLHLPSAGPGTWKAMTNGFFRYEGGAAATGQYPADRMAWLSLYGGEKADDAKLLLHLDGFRSATTVQAEGKGLVYKQDTVGMQQGAVTWKLG